MDEALELSFEQGDTFEMLRGELDVMYDNEANTHIFTVINPRAVLRFNLPSYRQGVWITKEMYERYLSFENNIVFEESC